MEKSKSAEILVKCFEGLYDQRERGGDFAIVSEHQEIPVHSFVILARSEVLGKSVTLDFEEKKTGKIRLDPFEKSVMAFVQFLYGVLDLTKLEVDTLLQLIQMGELYNVVGLSPVAENQLAQSISEENVFDILKLSTTNCFQHTGIKRYCLDFIAKNLPIESLVKNNKLQEFPDLAVYLIENEVCSSSASSASQNRDSRDSTQCSVRLFDRLCHHQEYSSYKTTIHNISVSSNSPVLLTGIRLSLAPGSLVSVRVCLSSSLANRLVLEKGKLSNDGREDEAKDLMFAEKFPLVPDLLHDISVQVCGRGGTGAVGFNTGTPTPTPKTRSFFPPKLLGGGGARGLTGDHQQVVFSITEDQSPIHEIYFLRLPASHQSPAFNWLKKK